MKRYKITKKKYQTREYNNWVNSLEIWSFDSKYLFNLVRSGKKRATSYLYTKDEKYNEYSVLKQGNKKLLLKTINVEVRSFKDVDEKFAFKEGEGDLSLKYWQRVHKEFFNKELNGIFNENIKIVCEEFCLIKRI